MNFARGVLLVCCLCMLATGVQCAQPAMDNEVAGWQARVDAARARVDALRNRLQAHNAPLWAGEYYQGDHLGFNLDLVVTRDRFAYTIFSDMGLMGSGYGAVEHTASGIVLHLAPNLKPSSSAASLVWDTLDTTLVPTPWGSRHYLVPRKKIAAFGSAINHGMEMNSPGLFLLRVGDEKVPVLGLDGLPDAVRRYVREVSVAARVTAVRKLAKWKGKPRSPADVAVDRYQISIDKGSADGILPGMELWQISPDSGFATVIIANVTPHRSRGVLSYVISDKPVPTVGWVFATGQYPPAPKPHCGCD